MLKIFRYFRTRDFVLVFVCIGLLLAQVWLDLKIPDYMSSVTSIITAADSDKSHIWMICAEMVGCALGSLTVAIFVGLIAAFVGAGFARRMRGHIYSKVDTFGMAEIDKFSTSSLVTRSTNDVTQVRMLITMGLQMLIKAPIMAVWAIVNISGKRFEWSIATVIALGILCIMFAVILILVIPKFGKMQTLNDNLNRIMRENLLGLSVIRAYNSEGYQQQKFEDANQKLVRAQIFTSRASSGMLPIMSLVMNGLTLSIFWMGAYLINDAMGADKTLIFGNTMVFSSYSVLIVQAFMQITMIFIFLPRASVSAKRILEVLNVVPSVSSGQLTQGLDGVKGRIEFDNVSFCYPNSGGCVLQGLSFCVEQGQTLAIIGSTGSGKTTIVNLINRFYDATSGRILVDGVDVKDYKTEALYQKIGLIPQKAAMFDGTVISNVGFGQRQVDQQKIETALSIAQGKDFVESMVGQYEAEIARGGNNISGGQKQRISIARAIYKSPEILIFDDSFSALDYKTDRAVRAALKNHTVDTTKVIVAQRIGTIRDADKILVLDKGQIVGIGTHYDLLKEGEVYKEIARSQLSEEELSV